MRRIFDALFAMKRSVIACCAVAILGLVSMGALGGMLYFAVYPVVGPFFGDPENWHGDWVWPALVITGVAWSASFLVAGMVNRALLLSGRGTPMLRRGIYALVLWLGAALLWSAFLLGASG